jgi:hypothetical protein
MLQILCRSAAVSIYYSMLDNELVVLQLGSLIGWGGGEIQAATLFMKRSRMISCQ